MSTAQMPIQTDSQAIPAYKRGKSKKPISVQVAIASKRANGDTITKIANDLELSRNTVYKVIESTNLDRNIETEQGLSLGLIRPAIQVMHDRLKKGSENAAIHVLENTIWPLQSKTSKQPDTALTLAIQNLMGNVQVNAQADAKQPDPALKQVIGPSPSE